MSVDISIVSSDQEINACFPAFKELRPKLSVEGFLPQVKRQAAQGYQILALRHNGEVVSAAGFRQCEFLAWGKVIYVDDLTSLPSARGQGFAGALLDWLIDYAKGQNCEAIHLDSGYNRQAAHRLYLNKGFQLSCHHLSLALAEN